MDSRQLLTSYVDDNDCIVRRTTLGTQIGASLVGWMLTAPFLIYVWVIGASIVKAGWPPLSVAMIWLLWLAMMGGMAALVFTLTCAVTSTLTLDFPSHSHTCDCGIFPLRFRRRGDLQDFEQVGRYLQNQSDVYVGRLMALESVICLSWRRPRWPYRGAFNRIALTTIVDTAEAERYGRELAARLDISYAEVLNKQLRRSRQTNLPPEIQGKP